MITTNQTQIREPQLIADSQEITSKASAIFLIPNNHINVILNLGDTIKKSMIGSIRSNYINQHELLILGCQSRGCLLECDSFHYIQLKIPAVFSRLMFSDCRFARNESEVIMEPRINNREELISFLQNNYHPDNFQIDSLLLEAIQIISENNGEMKIKNLYEMLDISKSMLEQKFSQSIGLTAKEFAKIEKFNQFIGNYRQYRDCMNLTQLTFKSGYYDQSHLIKDFRYYLDQCPGEFLKKYA